MVVYVVVSDPVCNMLSATLECRDALMLLAHTGIVGVTC